MNIAQIEENLQALIKSYTKESFIYDLLLAYNTPKASISRLQNGNLNQSKIADEISWKKKLFFKAVEGEDLTNLLERIKNYDKAIKTDPRFIVVTDYDQLIALDRKTQDKIDITIEELPKHFDFFLPWAGMEKATHQNENPADVKAAEKMAKLFVEIKKDNPDTSPEFIHGLNVFLSRLLFCFFAEDSNIFKLGQFTNAIASHTQLDGSDLSHYLETLFDVLNTPENKRKDLAEYLSAFPYVNGGLFKHKQPTPVFTRRSRQAIIDAGEMNWSDINPDIFGSMFQAVISVDQRGSLGQHYTSVPNIMKVIEPLFLNDLYEEFDNAIGNQKKLTDLLLRLQNIKIFDPACGSGNFLIIAYKELRKVEMAILNELQQLKGTSGLGSLDFGTEFMSHISLNNFYGIEIDDFAYEIAKLALWLAEHQMNMEFFKTFGKTNPTLPLKDAGQITLGNATRVDWEQVCPKKESDEIYILGNPPYLGFSLQNEKQKADMAFVFSQKNNYKRLDYICCWFYLGAKYIEGLNAKLALVSTNSICQGEQVPLLWPSVFDKNLEIGFAHTSFKWNNNAKANAAVIVIIVGLRNSSKHDKYLFSENRKYSYNNINAYLVAGDDIIIEKRSNPISNFPEMLRGNMPIDGGNLILSHSEKDELLNNNPVSIEYLRKFIGAVEFINNDFRWCLWIEDSNVDQATKIKFIENRIIGVRKMREDSTNFSTQLLADKPHLFGQIRHNEKNSIIIPSTTSERRDYIPIGFVDKSIIISNLAYYIPCETPYIFGILSSRFHVIWVKTFGGKLKSDYRYSSGICYNTFPFPKISDAQKQELEQSVFRILEERENHSEKTLAQLYDPDKMPEGLNEAHRLNDLAVERCYRSTPFENDEERLEYLFKLYEKMIAEEEKNKVKAKSKKTVKTK